METDYSSILIPPFIFYSSTAMLYHDCIILPVKEDNNYLLNIPNYKPYKISAYEKKTKN